MLNCCMLNQVLILVLLDLPGLLFFSTYTLLVLFWAEIYHQASALFSCTVSLMLVLVSCYLKAKTSVLLIYLDKELMNGVIVHNQLGLLTLFNHYYEQARSLPTDKLRIVYISVNAGMYFVQVCSILPLFMYCICCIPISSVGLFLGSPS